MLTNAVILAAGLGSRLGIHTAEKPKGFLQIDGSSLIETSIKNCLQAGIKHIWIGTGYLSEHYEALMKTYPITCVHNPEYARTGSMGTLACFKNILSEDFLLLESDLLYDAIGLTTLLETPHADCILVSGTTHSGDEVYIQSNPNQCLVSVSKDPTQLTELHGELTGLNKLSQKTFLAMCEYYLSAQGKEPMLDYEITLARLSRSISIHVLKRDDFLWCEIDNEAHLKRAIDDIYPALQKGLQ